MKAPNSVRSWRITLRGRLRAQTSTALFTGTLEDALAEADVLECYVRWQVLSIAIRATAP